MAHNLNSMFYVGKEPWHGLGKRLETEATAAEAIQAAGLDWRVAKYPCRAGIPGSERTIDVPWKRVVMREDTQAPLGVVGQDCEPVQNRDAFGFFDAVVGEGQAIYHTAGALGAGERTWIMSKIPGDLLIAGKDRVEKFLLLANSHDGSMALRMFLTPIRVVCQNTLNLALQCAEGGVTIRHSGRIESKIHAAKKAFGIAVGYYSKFGPVAEAMAARRMEAIETKRFLELVVPQTGDELSSRIENVRAEIADRIVGGAGHREMGIGGTAWGHLNGVAEYADHARKVRGETDTEKRSNRLESIWWGTSAGMKGRAFAAIGELTGIGAN